MKKGSGLKIIAIVMAVLLLVVGGGIAALYIMFPSDKIIALVVPHIEKALGRKVSLSNAGVSLYPGLGISLSGLCVENTRREGFSKEPFVKVDRFFANISLGSLFKGYPEITTIRIKKPELRIEADAKGSFNFDDLAATAKRDTAPEPRAKGGMPALPVPITLKKFVIEDGVIVYDDAKSGNRIVIGSVNQEIGVSMDKALRDVSTRGTLTLKDVSVKTREIKKPLKSLNITLSHDVKADLVEGAVTVNEVRLSLQKLYLTLRGTVKNALSPAPELDLTVATDPFAVADLFKELPPELVPLVNSLKATGTAELGLAVKGALAKGAAVPVQGTFALKGATVKFSGLPQSITDGNADIAFTENSVTVKALTMRLGTSPIDFKATVTDFRKPVVDAALKADLKLADLKDVMSLPPESSLEGRVVADVKVKGAIDPANPAKLDAKGRVDFKDVVMLWSPLIKPAKINGEFTLSSKAVGENLQVAIGQSSLTMAATVSNYLSFVFPDSTKMQPRPFVEFKLASPFLNIDEIIKPPDTTKKKRAGAKDAGAPMAAPLPGVDMKGTVTARKIIYQGFTMSDMTVRINVLNDIADIRFSTGFAGGTIGNDLHANLKNVNDLNFTNKLDVKAVELNDLLERFGSYIKPVTPLNREVGSIHKSLFGRISIQSSLSGRGGTADAIVKSLSGNAGVRMGEGRIENTPMQKAAQRAFTSFLKTDKLGEFDVIRFRDLSASLRLANGRALFDDLKIQSDVGDWNANGSVGFDALLDMKVATRLTRELSARLLAAEGALKGTVKGLAKNYLQGTQLAGAEGLLDNMNLIPRDNESRVTIKFGLSGPVADPKISSLAFGPGTTGAAAPAPKQPTPQQQVQQAIVEKKQEVQKAVEQKAEDVVKKAEGQLKEQAKDKLKGLWKK